MAYRREADSMELVEDEPSVPQVEGLQVDDVHDGNMHAAKRSKSDEPPQIHERTRLALIMMSDVDKTDDELARASSRVLPEAGQGGQQRPKRPILPEIRPSDSDEMDIASIRFTDRL